MYVKQNKYPDGRIRLDYYRSYRDKDGKSKSKLVESIGFIDDLEKEFDNPLQHFKAEAKRLTALEKVANSDVSFSLDFSTKTPPDHHSLKSLGYAFLQKIYYDLELDSFFMNVQRKSNIKYNFSNVIRLLTYERILRPASKHQAFCNQDWYFENFVTSKDSIYDALSRLQPFQAQLQAHLHTKVKELYGRDDSMGFFDCTNYYFEIDEEDELRRRGPSKEHRKTPIVQMGLLMDNHGIPMAYHLFPGNESEKLNLRPVLNRCRRDFNLNRIVVVADKGLNTSDNIFYTSGKGDGYIYSQSIKGSDKNFQDYVFNPEGYTLSNYEEGFRVKSRIIGKEIQIEKNGSRNHKVTLRQKQVVYYSPKYAERAKKERERVLLKAQGYVEKPGSYEAATNYGASKYVKESIIDESTGEVKQVTKRSKKAKDDEQKIHVSIDSEKIKEDEKFDGYYSIVTSEVHLSDEEIIGKYRGLWKIEESFKITKTQLNARPVYLSRKERIESHFFTCYLALSILRIIEKVTERRHAPESLIASLRKFEYANIGENIYQCTHRDPIIDDLDKTFGLDTSMLNMRLKTVKNILKNSKSG